MALFMCQQILVNILLPILQLENVTVSQLKITLYFTFHLATK
jgi:hypothetical protein